MTEEVEPEEHLGIIAHPDEWRPGWTCDDCRMAYEMRMMELRNPAPRANLRRLRHERETGVSSRDVERDTIESARREGRDLARPSDFATQHWKKQ